MVKLKLYFHFLYFYNIRLFVKPKNSSIFSIQLNESTDITHMSQLIVFVRYIENKSIK